MIYLDHHTLSNIFGIKNSISTQINTWLDRLSEFDLKVGHKSSKNKHICLVDRLSRMPIYYLSLLVEEDLPEHMPIRTTIPIQIQSKPVSILDSRIDKRYQKYQDLLMFLVLVKYFQKGLPALQELNYNQKWQLIWKTQCYSW